MFNENYQCQEDRWDMKVAEAKKWIESHTRHINPPRKGETLDLANWFIMQRKLYKKGALSSARVEELIGINFPFENTLRPDRLCRVWTHILKLKEYQAIYGHMHVPAKSTGEYACLGKWLSSIRSLRVVDPTNWRIKLVEEKCKNFPWEPRAIRQDREQIMYDCFFERVMQAADYVCQYGDIWHREESYDDPTLQLWAKNQLRASESDDYTDSQIHALYSLGILHDDALEEAA